MTFRQWIRFILTGNRPRKQRPANAKPPQVGGIPPKH